MYNVVIIGAGASGIGCAIQLKEIGVEKVVVIDKGEIGQSFKLWPEEMRFISPSFPGNAFELLDLNSIALQTSPAFSLNTEHPTGREYAQYLEILVEYFGIKVQTHNEVKSVVKIDQVYQLQTSLGMIKAKFIIYAGGDFHNPNQSVFPGAELCIHNSQVRSWTKLSGERFFIIGGYESAIDAAVNLSLAGKKATVIAKNNPLADAETSDPSVALAPFTVDRLKAELPVGNITLVNNQTCIKVEHNNNKYIISAASGKKWSCISKPILATGFTNRLGVVENFFSYDSESVVEISNLDESTQNANIFLAGPIVKHEGVILCFIYKFRQRFAVVVAEIAKRMGINTQSFIDHYKKHNMYLDDLTCCKEECVC